MAGLGVAVGELGFRAAAGSALKGLGKWVASLTPLEALALVLAAICAWQYVTIHGLEFKLIPGIGPKIHIIGKDGQIAHAKAETAAVRAQLATSQANEAGLRKAISDQNGAIADLTAKSAQQQRDYQKGQKAIAGRLARIQASRDALARSVSHLPPPGAPCTASDELQKRWKP